MSQSVAFIVDKLKTIFICSLLSLPVFGAAAPRITPSGVTGTAGMGVMNFQVISPENKDLKFDQGSFAAITAERGFGFLNLYLNLTLSYLTTNGNVNYSYTNLAGTTYSAANAPFKTDLFQAGLGLKLKLIDGYWFRPYVEGGGLGGYFTMKFTDLNTRLGTSQGTDYKTDDSLLDFGTYAEGGLEVQFSDRFGIRAAARFTDNTTKEFDTLGKTAIHYKASVYYFSLLAKF